MTIPLSPEEVNEAVALKLGWFNISRYTPMAWSGKKQKERMVGSFHTVGADASLVDVPDFCGKIEAAFEMLDRLEWSLSKQPDGIYCWLNRDGRIVKEIADTAPMAICLAYLKLE